MSGQLFNNVTSTEAVQLTEQSDFSTPSPSTLMHLVIPDANDPSIGDNATAFAPDRTIVSPTTRPDIQAPNSTDYIVDNDEPDYNILAAFSDMQTVFLACICTLLPLIVALGIAFGVRHVWRKYRNRRHCSNGLPWYSGVCSRENIVDSLHHRPRSGSTIIQPATRVLSAQDLVNGLDGSRYICDAEIMETVVLGGSNEYNSPGNHTSKTANGNIITLTLKNNHLIVETEERGVTMEDAKTREYMDTGCSFVVEVQPEYRSDEVEPQKGPADDVEATVTNQRALVHREEVPEDRTTGFENTKMFGSNNTGLSQSDPSESSPGSANPSYCYGNQLEYQSGHFGYPIYAGYEADDPPINSRADSNAKWVEFDKSPDTDKTSMDDGKSSSIDKNGDIDEQNTNIPEKPNNLDCLVGPVSSSIECQEPSDASNSGDAVNLNSNLQINGSTPNKLELMEQKALSKEAFCKSETTKPVITGALRKEETQEDTFQEQQRKLGNGTLTPEHVGGETLKDEKHGGTEGATPFVPCHRRSGSIPPRLIKETFDQERKKPLDIYGQINQIKSSTKSILPGLSPKFELLKNEVSPIEEKRES